MDARILQQLHAEGKAVEIHIGLPDSDTGEITLLPLIYYVPEEGKYYWSSGEELTDEDLGSLDAAGLPKFDRGEG